MVIRIQATDGSPVEFVDEIIGSGGMKDVYFSPDKSYVVGFFRNKQDQHTRDRLETITGVYRDRIFNQPGGDYWKDLFCWPTKIVEYKGHLGLVCPTYQAHFFFTKGSVNNDFLGIIGREKEGKWFASAKNQNRFLAPEERGDWFKYFQICIRVSRAVKRLHAAGLAHSDLSYKNVLIDPSSGRAAIIDIDGLVVPGKFPPDVLGTPDFIAPEVIGSKHLPMTDPNRVLPSITTDRHALAVMIYMYLFYRHPLRGGKVHDLDSSKDEELTMGRKALFIENPTDTSNQIRLDQLHASELPQSDTHKFPYTLSGPHLTELFNRAFINGLHKPALRPTADEWEQALLKTVDLMQPCLQQQCWHKWFVHNKASDGRCPFCGTVHRGQFPLLEMQSLRDEDRYLPDNCQLVVYHNQYLYSWHANRNLSPNEKLTEEQKKPLGYFVFHNNKWMLVNQRMNNLEDRTEGKSIAMNEPVELTEGKELILSKEDGGRMVVVKMQN